jgi:late competence protein required for DNA uptake (superfamily II DNA/RNA helicase)
MQVKLILNYNCEQVLSLSRMLVGLSTTSIQSITSTINRNNRGVFVAFLRFCARKLVWPSELFVVFLSHSRKVSDNKISPIHITHSDQYSRS